MLCILPGSQLDSYGGKFMVTQPSKLKTGLPKETGSLCPDCGKKLTARIFEENGKVMIEKTCSEDGYFKDVYWSDVELYLKAEKFAMDGIGVENPAITDATSCPDQCGLCNLHLRHTVLANLDLTNRCNLKCPICFANANQAGYVYEPTFDEIVKMMKTLLANKPVPCTTIQFAGGEPTIYPQYYEVLAKAKELGFAQIQVATNGLKFAHDPEFAQRSLDSGLHTVYLQFDGLREENYIAARGRPLLETKMKAIAACENTTPSLATVLVPTIIKGINDDQVGEILKFAVQHRKAVRGINFQPVAFTGRIDQEERERGRYTLPDLVKDICDQTGWVKKSDFYPVPFVAPVSQLISVLSRQPKVAFTAHPHCGLATYLFIDKDENMIPITKLVDVEGMMEQMTRLAKKASGTGAQLLLRLSGAVKTEEAKKRSLVSNFEKYFGEYIHHEAMPEGFNLPEILSSILAEGNKESLGQISWNTMFVGGMHFQDSYNYDIERVKRCVIHYAVPDGRIIPFCAYNGGPTYRTEIEKKYSVPLDEWKKMNKEEK